LSLGPAEELFREVDEPDRCCECGREPRPDNVVLDQTMDVSSFASVVAAMSRRGRNTDTSPELGFSVPTKATKFRHTASLSPLGAISALAGGALDRCGGGADSFGNAATVPLVPPKRPSN